MKNLNKRVAWIGVLGVFAAIGLTGCGGGAEEEAAPVGATANVAPGGSGAGESAADPRQQAPK